MLRLERYDLGGRVRLEAVLGGVVVVERGKIGRKVKNIESIKKENLARLR